MDWKKHIGKKIRIQIKSKAELNYSGTIIGIEEELMVVEYKNSIFGFRFKDIKRFHMKK